MPVASLQMFSLFILLLFTSGAFGYVPATAADRAEEAGTTGMNATDTASKLNLQWSNNGYSLFSSLVLSILVSL